MSIKMNNYEDHRNITIDAGMKFEVKINDTVVYTRTISVGKKGNIAFQLQEVEVT